MIHSIWLPRNQHDGEGTIRTGALFLLLLFPFSACVTVTPEKGIRHANEQFEQNARAKDIERLIREYYADQPIIAYGGGHSTGGVEGAKKFWLALLKDATVKLETERLESSCDLASEVGRWTLMVKAADGDYRQEKGEYYVTWKREGGSWKATLHAFLPSGFTDAD